MSCSPRVGSGPGDLTDGAIIAASVTLGFWQDLVASDILILRAGDIVPGDCRIRSAHRLLVDESALTSASPATR